MMKNSIFTLLILFMGSMPVLAQSNLPGSSGSQSSPGNSSNSGQMQNNPAKPNMRNPAMVNPSDPTGANSNIPGSGGMPPSSNSPGVNPGSNQNVKPPSGH